LAKKLHKEERVMKLENKQIGVFTALILGFIMLFLPPADKSKYSFNPTALARDILDSQDHVTPGELSEWIIAGKKDYQLIDIRSEAEFAKGSIKGAENIPLEKLLQKKTVERDLNEEGMIIIFSTGNSHAHQAWLVLNAAGKDVYALEGGYNYWSEVILNPKFPANIESDDEILKYNAAVSVANYFGGASGSVNDADTGKSKPKAKKRRKAKRKKLKGCS